MNSLAYKRRQYKWEAIVLRGGLEARCDLTGKIIGQGGDYHEMIPRAVTVANEGARLVSYRPELCAYLSQEAHGAFHRNEPTREQWDLMWQGIYRVFAVQEGSITAARARVQTVYDELVSKMQTRISYTLPEVNDET